MSRICRITGKRPMHGSRRSHAMNSTKRWYIPNIHSHRFWISSKNKFCSLRVSAKGMRLIDKIGIDNVLSKNYVFKKNKESISWLKKQEK